MLVLEQEKQIQLRTSVLDQIFIEIQNNSRNLMLALRLLVKQKKIEWRKYLFSSFYRMAMSL